MPNQVSGFLVVHSSIDAMMPNFTFTKVLTEGTPGTDSVLSQKIRPATLTEGAVGTDSVIKSIGKVLTEGTPGTDTILRASARALTEGAAGVDTVVRSIVKVLTEGNPLTDTLKVILNGSSVIWSHISKAAAAVWTHIDHS